MSDTKDELIEKNTVWYTRICANCKQKFPVSFIKPIEDREWKEPFICSECLNKEW